MNQLHNICIFCGASLGAQPVYATVAQALGRLLVERNIGLVYGGGSVGLMGEVARTVATSGGKVSGVIPAALKTKEIVGEAYGELITVTSMHERKATMARLADGFIALPGGFGTMDELFEAITWGQLGIHGKPIGLLNVAGYFTPILHWVDQAVSAGFVRPQYRRLLEVAEEPVALLDQLARYEPLPGFVKWENLQA